MRRTRNHYLPPADDFFEPDQHRAAFINDVIGRGQIGVFILLCEALQEQRLAKIARDIASRPNIRLVLLAGPSSSGKTSTARRLAIQLLTCRKWPVALSMDNWFVNRRDTPLGDDGKPDFETIHAVDLDLFNHDLGELIAGREVSLPTYDFQTGERQYRGDKLLLQPGMTLIIEGIHALNPMLTERLDDRFKYLVYASTASTLDLGDGMTLTPTDNRLLRRISRDYQTRGCSAARTLGLWPAVRRGEARWIAPFADLANARFDTAMLYELPAIKAKVEAMLREVPADDPTHGEAQRLLGLLAPFDAIGDDEIPRNSLLREFIGGSVFDVG